MGMSTAPWFKRMVRNIIGKGGRKRFPGGRKESLEIEGHSSSENTETQIKLAELSIRGVPRLEKHQTGGIRLNEFSLPGSGQQESCGLREKRHFVLPLWFGVSDWVRIFPVFGLLFCFGLVEKDGNV